MRTTDYYENDLLFFFGGRPRARAVYDGLFARLEAAFPDASVKVQKTQISFYGRRLFAMASLPRRRAEPGIVVSFGLSRRADSPRVAYVSEPYPGRWTHHVPVADEGALDGELMAWLREAYAFSESK